MIICDSIKDKKKIFILKNIIISFFKDNLKSNNQKIILKLYVIKRNENYKSQLKSH